MSIKVQASVSKPWLHTHGGFNFDEKYYTDPFYRMQQDHACHEFIKKQFPDYPLYNMEDNLVQAEFVTPNMMLVGAIQPNLIVAAALGAEFVYADSQDSDVKGFPLQNITDLSQLMAVEDVLQLPFIQKLAIEYQKAKTKYPAFDIIPPFFWDKSGRATIHGIVTTSMKFIGQDIFLKMLMEPNLIKGIHQWITDLYITIIEYFSKLGNLPVTSIHIGECSGTMLSNELYEEFVTPYLSQLGEKFGKVRLHSCGNADHVLDAICSVKKLHIIDTGSNTSIAEIRKRMGKDFEINVFPPVENMLKDANPKLMKDWLKKVIDENEGGNLKIEYHLEPEYNWENCKYIHDQLDQLGIVKKSRLY